MTVGLCAVPSRALPAAVCRVTLILDGLILVSLSEYKEIVMNKKVLMVLMTAVMAMVLVGVTAAFSGDDLQPVEPDRIDSSSSQVIGSDVNGLQSVEDLEAYWTDERLAEAVPLDVIMLDEAEIDQLALDADEPEVEAAEVEGGFPDADAEEWARQMFPEEWAAIDAMTDDTAELEDAAEASLMANGYDYPFPYNPAYYTPYKLRNDYPHRTIGKLYFTIPGQGNYSCTASVMVNRALWTAGHCVYTEGRGWHTNVVFIPAYRNGSRPFGTWYAKQLFTLNGWKNGKIAYDIGSVILHEKSGKTIAQTTGWLGASWGKTVKRHWTSFGYPGNIGSGKYPVTCQGSFARRDSKSGPDPVGFGCDMLHGSSGGPIIYKYAPYYNSKRNYVNGVNSYGYNSQPNAMYFSYFGTGAKNIYNLSKTK